MARTSIVTSSIGASHLMSTSPYNVAAQKAERTRKLSQGSPVVHVTRPATLFRGSRNGCEYASALVTCGGVAISRGDFW